MHGFYKLAALAPFALASAASAASAALMTTAYESFDYSAGTLTGNGSAADAGWGSSWLESNQAPGGVSATTLSEGNLVVGGNKASLLPRNFGQGSVQTYRLLSERVGDDESVIWMSFIGQKTNTGTRFFSLSLHDDVSVSGGSVSSEAQVLSVGHGSGGNNWLLNGAAPAAAVSTQEQVLAVLRIDFTGADDSATLWLDPALGGPAPADGDAYATGTGDFAFEAVRLGAGKASGGNSTSEGNFDEIRFGTTFAAVTPVPEPTAAVGLAGLAGIALRRQRR